MFERICICPTGPDEVTFDVGALAEALLFYREVVVIVRAVTLKSLVNQVGGRTLLDLADAGHLKLLYRQQ